MQRLKLFTWCLFLLVGCGQIAVEPKPAPPESITSDDYDVAVVSVDFDPALQGSRLPISDKYAVLVALENRGLLTAYNVKVNARLRRTSDDILMLSGSRSVNELAPGQIVVVRIEPEGAIPANADVYSLIVRAEPLSQETLTSNNTREFTIRVEP
ncbi:hypothetical protein [Herpetosiphon sp. NSE202]|uniref:hypothetical protein n=1 Tax=Herpetosiphon sp. NSE202 TaxID=3351349 RepID=UPI00362EF1A0